MDYFFQWQRGLHPVTLDLLKSGIWLVVLFAVFVPLEAFFARRKQAIFRPFFALDVAYYFINNIAPKIILALLFSDLMVKLAALDPVGYYRSVASIPAPYRFVMAVVVGEVGAYWGHRMMHKVGFLWRFHAVHHSAEQLDWLVNTRAHPLDMVITRACGLLPVYLLGIVTATGLNDKVLIAYALFGAVWSFFIHANLKWRFGPLEWLLSTPAFHHWHHTRDGTQYIDKNFAAIFPWVDRLFGTLYLPKHFPQQYGVDSPAQPPDLLGQLIQPFLPAKASVSAPITKA
jgi:sterol desaturase/sphingolipid hydroxylase (fatty acid hydroxylase superfamily)